MTITGLKNLDPGYVERRLRWQRGEAYDAAKVEETRRALIESGLFSTVRITPAADPDQPGSAQMTIDATERPHRTIGAGVGYNTSQGAAARVFWENRNLFGNAEYLRLSATGGQQVYGVNANFRRPDFLVTDQDFLATAEIADDTPVAYHSRRALATAGLERRFGRLLTGGVLLEAEEANVEQLANVSTNTSAQRTQRYALFGVPAYVKLDTTDNLLSPTRGWRAQLSVTPAHIFSSPSLTYVTSLLSASTYWKVDADGRAILAGRAALGSLDGAPLSPLPADQRIYVGGGGTIRPYGYQMAGPLAPNNDPIGGKSSLVLNFEISHQGDRHDRRGPVRRCRQLLREQRAAARPAAVLRGRAGPALLHPVRAAAARSGDPALQAQRRFVGPGLCQPRRGVLMRAVARWLAFAIAVSLALVLAAFGLLQTRIGQDWLAAAVARAASSPSFSLTIEGLRRDACRCG